MVFVFGAERTLGTMQTFDIIVHQQVGGEAAFVRKLLIAFVTRIHHFDASVSAWQWPGAYPYAAADSAYTNFLACLKALYIGVGILILFKLR